MDSSNPAQAATEVAARERAREDSPCGSESMPARWTERRGEAGGGHHAPHEDDPITSIRMERALIFPNRLHDAAELSRRFHAQPADHFRTRRLYGVLRTSHFNGDSLVGGTLTMSAKTLHSEGVKVSKRSPHIRVS